MRSKKRGKNKQEQQMPARKANDATLSDELNSITLQKWCPKRGEHSKIWNFLNENYEMKTLHCTQIKSTPN